MEFYNAARICCNISLAWAGCKWHDMYSYNDFRAGEGLANRDIIWSPIHSSTARGYQIVQGSPRQLHGTDQETMARNCRTGSARALWLSNIVIASNLQTNVMAFVPAHKLEKTNITSDLIIQNATYGYVIFLTWSTLPPACQ